MRETCSLLIAFVILAFQAAVADPNNITGANGLIMIDKRGGFVRFFDPETLQEISELELDQGRVIKTFVAGAGIETLSYY